MVLADGGVVCIDEFDKMRSSDRVAIHEAMEQQTISVAKAGITTVLNSRTSVLAAANPVFGRYDDLKSAEENIDLMSTILSRFDLIFLVRDIRDEVRDREICKHVMGVHMTSNSEGAGRGDAIAGDVITDWDATVNDTRDDANPTAKAEAIAQNALTVAREGGTLDVNTLKKYIYYCRTKCRPALTQEAGDVLASSYVTIRDNVRQRSRAARNGGDDQSVIPITVRQLEALVRLSESLAKMRLDLEVHAQDVAEALRLFKVSTMAANAADEGRMDSLAGGGDEIMRVEGFLTSRLIVGGTMVNKQRIVEECTSRGFDANVAKKAIAIMVMRGELQERNHGRLIKRIK